MHSYADILHSGYSANLLQFLASAGTVKPRIDAVQPDFGTYRHQFADLSRDVGRTIARSPSARCRTLAASSLTVLEGNHEERRRHSAFQLGVSVELEPEVLCQS